MFPNIQIYLGAHTFTELTASQYLVLKAFAFGTALENKCWLRDQQTGDRCIFCFDSDN